MLPAIIKFIYLSIYLFIYFFGLLVNCLGGMERYENHVIKYHDDIYDYDVNIMSPAFYCAHKIVINSKRKADKQEKDAIAIRNVLSLIEKREDLKNEFINVVNELTKNERKSFLVNIKLLDIEQRIISLTN